MSAPELLAECSQLLEDLTERFRATVQRLVEAERERDQLRARVAELEADVDRIARPLPPAEPWRVER